ncbi:MAG: DUF6293 family protein [Methanomassiliicoccaceae archaeon]|nr:DUF6293 family protein [Methanomassiliicoccaceae archaeon]
MATGKRERVMISCVTFETVKITEPIRFYDANRVHLIHYVKEPGSFSGTLYQEFYDEVCRIINKNSGNEIIIKEYEEEVSQFLPMLRLILNIIKREFDSDEPVDLYINVSAGTSEYTAAAVIASMMNPDVIPFSVDTDRYTVKDDMVKDAYYRDGVPVGLTETVFEPTIMPKYNMPMPDKNLVLGLRILEEMNRSKRNSKGPDIIMKLKEQGLWRGSNEGRSDQRHETKTEKGDSVYYYRDYVSRWLSNGWVEKNDFRKRYDLTEEGLRIIGTFYAD